VDTGHELALLYSVVTICPRNEVNTPDYLSGVLERIDFTEPHALRELLPDRWRPAPKTADGELLFGG
jgi:hypothetical protein